MELLLDTHILLWLVTDSPRLSPKAKAMIEDVDNTCLFSPVSISEISFKHKKHPDQLSFNGEAARAEFLDVGIGELPLTAANAAEADSLEFIAIHLTVCCLHRPKANGLRSCRMTANFPNTEILSFQCDTTLNLETQDERNNANSLTGI